MKYLSTLFVYFIMLNNTIAQKEDYVWILGRDDYQTPIENIIFDFNQTPMEIKKERKNIPFQSASSSICDENGNLLYYSNGIKIFEESTNDLIQNGDSLNIDDRTIGWENEGRPQAQWAFSIHFQEDADKYYLLHQGLWYDDTLWRSVVKPQYITTIERNQNNLFSVIKKNIPFSVISSDNFSANRHANGRDWWILSPIIGENKYSTYLFTPYRLRDTSTQEIGIAPSVNGDASNVFSPDGTKYAIMNPVSGVHLFDFDRCTGALSNPRVIKFKEMQPVGGGASFSSNSRFLYVCSNIRIYQIDMEAPLESCVDTVATFDGFRDPVSNTFFLMQLGPDGKIYISSTNSTNHMHVINYPNEKGIACDVCQHCLELPVTNTFTMPYYPNYRLGALDGSPCDTLGLDAPPGTGYPDNVKPAFSIQAYPNPATVELNLAFPYNIADAKMILIDVAGREVYSYTFPDICRGGLVPLPTLPSGIYFACVYASEGYMGAAKVVVMQ